jgi:hypothetical protein
MKIHFTTGFLLIFLTDPFVGNLNENKNVKNKNIKFQESKIRIDDFKYTFDKNYTNATMSLKEYRNGVIFNSNYEFLVEVPVLLV